MSISQGVMGLILLAVHIHLVAVLFCYFYKLITCQAKIHLVRGCLFSGPLLLTGNRIHEDCPVVRGAPVDLQLCLPLLLIVPERRLSFHVWLSWFSTPLLSGANFISVRSYHLIIHRLPFCLVLCIIYLVSFVFPTIVQCFLIVGYRLFCWTTSSISWDWLCDKVAVQWRRPKIILIMQNFMSGFFVLPCNRLIIRKMSSEFGPCHLWIIQFPW